MVLHVKKNSRPLHFFLSSKPLLLPLPLFEMRIKAYVRPRYYDKKASGWQQF